MSAEDHERWQDDLGAYALGALEGRELAALEDHLAECERCQAELHWMRPTIDAIPTSVEQVDPPRALRRSLMATVREEARESARADRVRRPGWRSAMLRPATSLAIVAALAAAGLGGYLLAGPDGTRETTVAAHAVAGAPGHPSAVLVREGDSGTLEAHHLPKLSGGDVYQAWVTRGKSIRPSTIFVVDRRGDGTAAIRNQLDGADGVMVTREPHGGSRKPTAAPLLHATLG